ncbi:sulfurtransferase TusA family protein [Alicyclobacillus sp. SO9]|uniref:sulfurtransferase TusA family protein n=1 Tax=Alicyclobacillus sp. SO9 TaxID=2665646 RepID=UPI0018E8E49A|nr:sulfurtransferase TusA family protein [Alicyclobacillus sp. SO9]QQE79338.1 sulfurtransferase TusA family protein [Alicyclobacillus sp. SO9]
MIEYAVDKIIDCAGMSCPMPVVKTKKAIQQINPGQVLGVIATDAGSVADVKSWASRMGHHFLGTEEREGKYHHYIRRAHADGAEPDTRYALTISTEGLMERLNGPQHDESVVLDVREPDEFESGHIKGAISVPLGQLEYRLPELKPLLDKELFVICRSGSRSESACHILTKHGFTKAVNVSDGMKDWLGPTE